MLDWPGFHKYLMQDQITDLPAFLPCLATNRHLPSLHWVIFRFLTGVRYPKIPQDVQIVSVMTCRGPKN